jgi:2-methylisocitrate lyase-like PEP mutase family enzyme
MAFESFRALHHADAPLLLPNAWDHASAAGLAAAGFAAIGTTSLGVAAAAGKPDAEASTRAETVQLARSLRRLDCLVTVDVEGGFSDDPGGVADLAAELAELGMVGLNLEDGRADATRRPAGDHARIVAAVKERAPRLFVNARTDTFWLDGVGASMTETTERARAYVAAGADGVFVPGPLDDAATERLVGAVEAPLNVLFTPGARTMARLGELGVARVSTGSLLFREGLRATFAAATAIRDGGLLDAHAIPGYDEVQRLAG